MQRMAEFVEQGVRLVDAEEASLAVSGAGEIHHVEDNRQRLAVELVLVAQRTHPRAAMLRGPGEIVADEERDRRSRAPKNRPRARIGMVEADVAALDEGKAEQAMSDVERRRDHPSSGR